MKTLVDQNGLSKHRRRKSRLPHNSAGFTLIEMLIVMVIAIILSAMAVPVYQNVMTSYRLSTAASTIAGAIQSTRYRAIAVGCSYKLVLTTGSTNYQILTQAMTGNPPSCPTTSTYTNVGDAIPWTSTTNINLSSSVTLTFIPNGTVVDQTGSPPSSTVAEETLSINGLTKNIYVSGVGYVTVK